MRFHTYTKFKGSWLDALNLENLLEHMADFLLDGGFAGGPHFHPYWGFSGTGNPDSLDALKKALLKALLESGELTPEMVDELRGEGEGDPEIQAQIAELLDDLIQKLVEEGYLSLEDQGGGTLGPTQDVTGQGTIDEARDASKTVNFDLTQKGIDFLGYRTLKYLLGALGKAEPLAEPLENDELHLDRARGLQPRALEDVEAGRGETLYDPRKMITSGPGFKPKELE